MCVGRDHTELLPDGLLTNSSFQTSPILKMNLSQHLNLLASSSTDDLNKLLHAVQAEIAKRKSGLTEFIPDFCPDNKLLEAVWKECESLEMDNDARKASTKWLCATGQPYIYPDKSPVHEASDITKLPGIMKLLSIVNDSSAVSGPLDSCLVLKYCSNKTRQSLHSDNEDLIDQSKSICSFSLGSERTLDFYGISKNSKKVCSYNMTHNSMVVMSSSFRGDMGWESVSTYTHICARPMW